MRVGYDHPAKTFGSSQNRLLDLPGVEVACLVLVCHLPKFLFCFQFLLSFCFFALSTDEINERSISQSALPDHDCHDVRTLPPAMTDLYNFIE